MLLDRPYHLGEPRDQQGLPSQPSLLLTPCLLPPPPVDHLLFDLELTALEILCRFFSLQLVALSSKSSWGYW